jgi:cobalt-zinc-cadmium efflux system protein
MHSHSHGHGHHHHDSSGNIKTAFFLNLGFTLIELVGGYFTNSLAIMTDALHDLGDTFALGFSWYMDSVSKKPRTTRFSYGLGRFSLLSAFVSSCILLFGSLYLLSEAIPRLLNPEHSNAPGMIAIAVLGVVVNGAVVLKLRSGKSMNERVVFWHLLEDVLGWVAVLVTGIIILIKDIHILDPLLSIGIVLYVLWNVFKNLKTTVTLFLQGVPDTLSIGEVEEKLKTIQHVQDVHDTHIWTMDGEHHILTTHAVVDTKKHEEEVEVKNSIKQVLEEWHIMHATIELEHKDDSCHGSC